MTWLTGRTGDAAICLDSPPTGLGELLCKPSGDGKHPIMNLHGREIAMSTVGPNVVIDGNELFQVASNRVDIGKVCEIERPILDGLIG